MDVCSPWLVSRLPENAPMKLLPEIGEILSPTVVYVNVRSLHANHPYVCADRNLLGADVLVFSESHADEAQRRKLALPGFPHSYFNPDELRFGSLFDLTGKQFCIQCTWHAWFRNYGIAVYSKTPLEVERFSVGQCAIEVAAFSFHNHLILALYRSPSKGTVVQLLELLDEARRRHMAEDMVVVVGDFNVDLLRGGDASSSRILRAWMEGHDLVYRDLGPTTDQATAIDQLWANCQLGDNCQTLDCHYSDHKKILISLLEVPCDELLVVIR